MSPDAGGAAPRGGRRSAEIDDLAGLVRRSLAGSEVGSVLDELGHALDARLPGHRFAVVGTVAGSRVQGRRLDLPRKVRAVLDRVVAGGEPGRPAGHREAVVASGSAPPWAAVVGDLTAASLDLPLLVGLGAEDELLGVVAAFPPAPEGPVGHPAPDVTDDPRVLVDRLGLGPWVDVAALLLARERDRERSRRATVREEATGLPAPALLAALLREALHRPGPVAVVHVDLERLDHLGDPDAGEPTDDLVRLVAERVRAVVRPDDVVGHARGGLVVVGQDLDSDGAHEVAERVRVALTAPLTSGADRQVVPTPGVGVVVAGPDDTVEALLLKASLAARESAAAGGSATVRYRPGTLEAARERAGIEHDLRRAVAEGGLDLVYQPQVSLVDGSVVGVEALVRWDRPGRGPVPPDRFIPVAEDTGLVVELGTWAIDRALADLAAGLPVVVSVNLSARQLDEPTLITEITAALDRHGVAPDRLRVEVTETTLARDPARGEERLRALHDLGVRVSIDDFGTGYAGLENLRRTEVADSLKVDRSFVGRVGDDPRDRAIVAAAVTLGRALGATVVAEGVETAEQARVVAELGCDVGQGYRFGSPVPVGEIDLRPRRLDLGAKGHA